MTLLRLFISFLCLSGAPVQGQLLREYVPGAPLNAVHSATSHINESRTCSKESRLTCDGCFTQLVCDYDQNVLLHQTCPLTRPYCTEGHCSTIPSLNCSPDLSPSAKRSDLCPGSGFYPDPLSCSRFNYCTSESQAIAYVCPTYYAYDPVTTMCKLHQRKHDCPYIDCARHHSRFVTYPLDHTLFTYCAQTNGSERILLYQCMDEMVFDEELQQCVYGCFQGEGKFPYEGDETRYYLCMRDFSGTLKPFEMSCGTSHVFIHNRCVYKASLRKTDATTFVPVHKKEPMT